ncbi:uncharacterized protein N0V89_003100 [Didymosphaeria variabile]|uniref:Uncharacterized protein n=1 Tax=Didymosphaeria variabile TaxID=1932322 RepID=A0A9W8XTB9_9PLEO|nr:uncharacterized protein N0V89_003100 [Didymosphaeria variabile]KAJ4358516.1 hypothetical protein N0V89_003100 [Didymosphaeria variabile]
MPPNSRIPPLLQPFVRTPKNDSLLLLTSTLDASANWLLTRFLCDALGSGAKDDDNGGPKNVVLVSWMRDYEGRLAFVDGLSELFLPIEHDDGVAQQRPQNLPTTPTGMPATRGPQTLPVRGPPGRTAPTTAQASPRTPTTPPGLFTLSSTSLDHINDTISTAIASLRPSTAATKTLVILDNPDILLATDPNLTPSKQTSLFLSLHTQKSVSHVLVHLQSDLALLATPEKPSPLQIAQQNLVVKTAHMSTKVLGVRLLDTGVARDVSGVLRVTVNRDSWADIATVRDQEDGGAVQAPEEKGIEVLYKVNGDGSVKVFERGTGGTA